MAITIGTETSGERRRQWQRLEKHWRDHLEESIGWHDQSNETSSGADGTFTLDTAVGTPKALKEALSTCFQVGRMGHEVSCPKAEDAFEPAFTNLIPFTDCMDHASQYEEVPRLIWTGLLYIGANRPSQSDRVRRDAIDLVLDLCESLPFFLHEDATIYELKRVQCALQDLFEDVMAYCTYVCPYFTKPGSRHGISFSRSPQGMLEATKRRISRHTSQLRDATANHVHDAHSRQDSAIVAMVPPGISDMPQRAGNRSLEATDVEFPVHTVYRAPNSAFVGREDILENMHRKIEGPSISEHGQQQSPLICVLHGLGGVGKTLIALKYFHEHRSDYDAAFWLEAEQDWSLEASFTRIAEKLKLATRMSSESETSSALYNAVEQGREWLQTTERRWILVFDNVEDFDEVARYMPGDCRANCTIIITTQSPNVPHWLGNFEMIHVTALDPESAADCIFKYLDREPFDDEEKDVACELAEHVGCLPLAMATIGGYVKQSDMPLVDFFENIKQKATLWENAPKIKETQGYYGSLQSVFNKAFEDLTPSARELLNVLAFYDPEYIPEDIFIAAIDARKFEHIHNKGDLFACYFELRNRQLVRRDTANRDSYISIHRVVQWNVLLDLSCDYDKRWTCFKQAFDIVKALLPKTDPKVVPEPNIWKDYVKHGRQILALRTHCLWPEPPVQLPMAFADILSEMGTYMWFSGKISEGKRILRTAESIIDDKNIKPSDERRAHVYQVLGIITSFEGVSEREGSMQMRKNAYHSRNQGLGRKPERELTRDEAIMVWAVYSDMAFGFIQEEDFFETKQYMEKCLAQYRKWESDEMTIPYEYAKYYQLMSYCHMAGQKPMDAMHAITRCHELTQRAVGNEHSFSQLIKFCHANLLWHTKGPDARAEALAINKSVLAYRRQLLGEYSQFVLESYSTCGKLCHEAGELTSAKGYLETCLQRRKRAVWNEEGITRAYFRYAGVLRTLAERAKADGNAGEAEALIQKADGISANVTKIVQRYRIDYARYLPKSESASEEANLDQMVSIWSGRFTGRLVQHNMDLSGIDDVDFEGPPVKRRRIGAG